MKGGFAYRRRYPAPSVFVAQSSRVHLEYRVRTMRDWVLFLGRPTRFEDDLGGVGSQLILQVDPSSGLNSL